MYKFLLVISFLGSLNISSQSNLKENSTAASYTWYPFTGSRNIHGVVNGFAKPLQYNPSVNAVSFLHQASPTYSAIPSTTLTAKGSVVAMISTNFGLSWDSACIWSDSNLISRNPQGAIYNPPGNTNLANTYLVGCGSAIDPTAGDKGNWYASRKLDSFDNLVSSTPMSVQFMPNTSPYGSLTKHDRSESSFSATDDGFVRSISVLANNINVTSNITYGLRGALIVKGTFNAGSFLWTGDSLIPPTTLRSDGTKQFYQTPLMAWNQSGTIGYVVFIGSKVSATNSNAGWQPIIYKTTNSGTSWALTNGIDFNAATVANNYIKGHMEAVNTNTVLKIPYFNYAEGIGLTVDAHDNLHIATTVASTKSDHQDSLEFTKDFLMQGELYKWPHIPGRQIYLYDFIGDGNTMGCALIDSIPTEAPGLILGSPGYIYNPWDTDPLNNKKVTSGSRIQLSRTEDGEYIIYSWAESDTNFTFNSNKWNTIPNLKARCLNTYPKYRLSSVEIPLTKTFAPNTLNPNVASRAMFHHVSSITGTMSNQGDINLPITVSNNLSYTQFDPVTHYFANVKMSFPFFFSPSQWFDPILSVKKESLNEKESYVNVFPNPANDVLQIKTEGMNGSEKIIIYNNIGQIVKKEEIVTASNTIALYINDLTAGIYFLKVQDPKTGNFITKPFVVVK